MPAGVRWLLSQLDLLYGEISDEAAEAVRSVLAEAGAQALLVELAATPQATPSPSEPRKPQRTRSSRRQWGSALIEGLLVGGAACLGPANREAPARLTTAGRRPTAEELRAASRFLRRRSDGREA